ncbi:hypothetical protein CSAL01_04803 [Colletotrichum salicis]|uniref:Uncharacterized protein n=1 Tax=Colletotrichum salicis TaxID=1209931 RepID=A0A135TRZ5_9PEZI|nr:hypothetical protein CSAL01_04803 [Colletotrichum salicis]
MRLTAEIGHEARQRRLLFRCFGPRLTNLLQAVQQFAALGDVVVGGSQNLVACGVWAAVRMTLHMCIGLSSYLEKLSLLFMTAGRQAPRHQAMALIYPKSKELQNHLCEYFIVVTHICHRVQSFARKSTLSQMTSSLNDSDIKDFQSDLVLWSTSIKEEVDLLLNQHHETEARLSAKARALAARWSSSTAHRFDVEKKSKWLDSCSTYDFETTWKQMKKLGSTSLLATSSEYQQWKNLRSSTSILFSGKIEAGKSVTMANVVGDEDFAHIFTFRRTPNRPETTQRYHNRILKFLAAAYEPLTSTQIREMATVTIGEEKYGPERLINNINKVLGFCGSLIVVDEEESTVRFVHHSAKSFCQGSLCHTSNWQFTEEEAHNEFGGTILTYLNYSILETKLSRNVIPKIDAGKISTGIICQTFHDSPRCVRLAGNLFKSKVGRSRQIGHVLAQNSNEVGIIIPGYPFLAYAREFWLLHTRVSIMPSVHRLWFNLVDSFDLLDLRDHPFAAAAWANILMDSQELNPLISDNLQEWLLNADTMEYEMRIQIFRRACLMGFFDMAVQTRPTARHGQGFMSPMYRGDEINLALQTISEERFRLATWLLADDALLNGVESSGGSVPHRAVLLRHWHLASTLLEHGASTEGLLEFCTRMDLAHFCVLNNNLEGIVFLAKATRGVALIALSAGPVFTAFVPIHVAAFRDSDWCRVYSIGKYK